MTVDGQSDANRQEEARRLLIFDNSLRPDLFDDYWPVGDSGFLLVTSGDPLAKTALSSVSPSIDLEALDPEKAASLFSSLTQVQSEVEESNQIVKKLEGLPLSCLKFLE